MATLTARKTQPHPGHETHAVEPTVFRAEYAGAYDAIYADKDYAAECDAIASLFDRFGRAPTRRVLDAGCGTGGHALILAARGYDLTGVDRSESMLDQARLKSTLAAGDLHPRWVRSDLRQLDLGETFDAALMMFAVLGYQIEDQDAHRTLSALRRHLEPGGLLVFDAWHAPAVIAQQPGSRSKVFAQNDRRMERVTSAALDPSRNVCHVHFTLKDLSHEGACITHESHMMRYFSVAEIDRLLGDTGLKRVGLGCMDDIDRKPTEADWTMVVTARARE